MRFHQNEGKFHNFASTVSKINKEKLCLFYCKFIETVRVLYHRSFVANGIHSKINITTEHTPMLQ